MFRVGTFSSLLANLALSLLTAATFTVRADVIRVNAAVVGGTGTGDSWTNSVSDLQSALALAQPGDELWVARGIYYPDLGTGQTDDDPLSTFALKHSVNCYGGFAGNEVQRSDRDPVANRAILSGDLTQDDLDGDGNGIAESAQDIQGTNCHHVLSAVDGPLTATLAGFVVTAGDSPDTAAIPYGGGLINHSGDLTIRDALFSGNRAAGGGGAYSHNQGTNSVFTRCQFLGNTASSGGAIWSRWSEAYFANCRLAGNWSVAGGALSMAQNAELVFVNSVLSGNHSSERGGAIYAFHGEIGLVNCVLSGNRADDAGGAAYISQTQFRLSNGVIWNNEANRSTETLEAGVITSSGRIGSFQNSIVANTIDHRGFWVDTERVPDATNTNLDSDPFFLDPVDPAAAPTTAGGFRTQGAVTRGRGDASHLPADKGDLDGDGNTTEPVPLDLGERERFTGTIDLGAYEAEFGPSALPVPVTRVPWDAGALSAAFQLQDIFDPTATQFALVSGDPAVVTPIVDATTGLVRLILIPDSIGTAEIVVSATDPGGNTTLLELEVVVFQNIIYVDASAPGEPRDGFSWAQSKRFLADAIAIADPGTEIWVAAGTYYPDEGEGITPDWRGATFRMRHDVSIYGGFAGGETSRDQRDPAANATILSGDVEEDDVNDDGNMIAESPDDFRGRNAEQIMCHQGGGPSQIDGLIFTGGDGPTRSSTDYAGALLIANKEVTVSNCSFIGNRGRTGGALACLSDNWFPGPVAFTISDCIFRGNVATNGGGAAFSESGYARFIRCEFTENQSEGEAGALHRFGTEHADFVNCRFTGNSAARNGGALTLGGDVNVINCEISGNHAGEDAGGIYLNGARAATLVNTTITGNRADGEGGGLYLELAHPVFQNCILWGNGDFYSPATASATLHRSGRPKFETATPTFAHCVVEHSGGSTAWNLAIGTDLGSNLDTDPLFATPIDPESAPTTTGDVRPMEAGLSGAADPAFLAADDHDLDQDGDVAEKISRDLQERSRVSGAALEIGAVELLGPEVVQPLFLTRYQPNSPDLPAAIDLSSLFDGTAVSFGLTNSDPSLFTAVVDPQSGLVDLSFVPSASGVAVLTAEATDAGGNTTRHRLTVELIADVIYVDANNASATPDGFSWEHALPSLQDALALVSPGSEIWIAAGRYYPDEGVGRTADDPEETFQLLDEVVIYGGFAGTEQSRDERDPSSHRSILSADLTQDDLDADGDGYPANPGEIVGTNAKVVVTGSNTDSSAVLDGVVITAAPSASFASGLYSLLGNQTITGCTFVGNAGGGYLCHESNATFTDCLFTQNAGGGASLQGTSVSDHTFLNCSFLNNVGPSSGGIFASGQARITVIGCRFQGNRAEITGGGAVWCRSEGRGAFVNCLITGNWTAGFGGGINDSGSGSTFVHCTVAGNYAERGGGGIYSSRLPAKVQNSIVWDNFCANDPASHSTRGRIVFDNSIVQFPDFNEEIEGANNLAQDPVFATQVDPHQAPTTTGDFRTLGASVLDTGSAAHLPADTFDLDSDGDLDEPLPFDFADNPRLFGLFPDPGAYERQSPGPRLDTPLEPPVLGYNFDPYLAAMDLRQVFGPGVTEITLLPPEPANLFTAALGPQMELTLSSLRGATGRGRVVVEGRNNANETSRYALAVTILPVVYVNASAEGTNDGSSWGDAQTNLQDALAIAADNPGQEIWVAQGVYYPDEGLQETDNARLASFTIPALTTIRGGFSGQSYLLSASDPSDHPTVLSGDLEQDDIYRNANGITMSAADQSGDNSITVVLVPDLHDDVLLNGLVITAGHADGEQTSPSANKDHGRNGGGLHASVAVTIVRCSFFGNYAQRRGAGAYAYRTNFFLIDTVASGNSAHEGGAFALYQNSNGFEPLIFDRCTATENIARTAGGGIFIQGGRVHCRNTILSGNSATTGGGAVAINDNDLFLEGCLLSGNYSSGLGGALFGINDRDTTYRHCTFTGNRAGQEGGALYQEIRSRCTIESSVFWDNIAENASIPSSHTAFRPGQNLFRFLHCIVPHSRNSDGSWNTAIGIDQTNNLEIDPLFVHGVSPDSAPSTKGDFRLMADSPGIDTGTTRITVTGADLNGVPRSVNVVDRGAYELPADTDRDSLPDSVEMAHTDPPSATALDPLAIPDGDEIPLWVKFARGFPIGEFAARDQGIDPGLFDLAGNSHFGLTYQRNPAASPFVRISLQTRGPNPQDQWEEAPSLLHDLIPRGSLEHASQVLDESTDARSDLLSRLAFELVSQPPLPNP